MPTGSVRYGDDHIANPYFAEGVITPTNLVLQGTAVNQVKINTAGNQNVIGVADVNSDALAEDLDVLTHAYASGDECVVIQSGIVVVVADTAGIVAGEKVMVGISTSGFVDVYTSTAAQAADTYKTANLDLIAGEIREIIGHALTTAATTVKALILLDL
jgi:phosphoserine aminotransferase